jgi:hypothetical protein
VGFLATCYTSIVPVFALTPGGRRTELRDAKGRKMMNTMAYAKANTGLFVIFRYGTYKTYPRLFFRYHHALNVSPGPHHGEVRGVLFRVVIAIVETTTFKYLRVFSSNFTVGHCEGVDVQKGHCGGVHITL